MGRNLQTKTSVYMSADAGLSWHQVRELLLTFRRIQNQIIRYYEMDPARKNQQIMGKSEFSP